MSFSLRWSLPRGFRRRSWGAEPLNQREQVIRRIVQLNAEVHRLEQIGEESEPDFDEVEAHRSVQRLRISMAREEVTAVRAELATLGRRLDQLDGLVAPSARVARGSDLPPVDGAGTASLSLEAAELSALSELQAVYRRDRASRGRMIALAVLVVLAAAGAVLFDNLTAQSVRPSPRVPAGVRVIEPRVLSLKAYGPELSIPENVGAGRSMAINLVETIEEWDLADD